MFVKKLITTAAVAALSISTAFAQDVQEIVNKASAAAYYQGEDGRAKVHMSIKDAQGRERTRDFVILRKDIDNVDNGEQRFYVFFERPADVNKTSFLVWKHADADDDRWLYLPALDLVKRIAPSDERTSFVGSHFFYEDVSGRGPEEDNHVLVEETDDYYVVSSTPKDTSGVEFASYKNWIHKATLIPVKTEYYDESGDAYRTYTALGVETIDGKPTVVKSSMADTRIGGVTEMQYSEVAYDTGLPEDIFSERYLRNPPRRELRQRKRRRAMKLKAILTAAMLGATPAIAQDAPPLPAGLSSGDVQEEANKKDSSSGAPALPSGLDDNAAPALPSGLGEPTGPALPPGLAGNERETEETTLSNTNEPFSAPFGLTGFVEARAGSRIVNDPTQKELSIGEIRAQLGRDIETRHATFRFVGDFFYDQVEDVSDVNLETGRGFFDLREANVLVRPLDFLDIKAGRQILTWGVGDLVFINDLFPKDFRSFFIGRDDEYLKAPSDAIRVSAFSNIANIEVVYTPRFDADRFITGDRISYYNPTLGRIAGRDAIIAPEARDSWFSEDEFAARAYRNIAGFETALYGYAGYWKTPEGQSLSGEPFHPRLAVIGGSLRGPVRGGILTAEAGHYFSRDDLSGADPFIRNSETRFLVGYEREIASELTASVQYVGEILSDYDAFSNSLPLGAATLDRMRHVVTLRLTKLMLNQNLTLSGFNFWSPNEKDGYFRFRASYKLNDAWLTEAGGNIFYGSQQDTFFGQLQDNTNLFVGIRRNF